MSAESAEQELGVQSEFPCGLSADRLGWNVQRRSSLGWAAAFTSAFSEVCRDLQWSIRMGIRVKTGGDRPNE